MQRRKRESSFLSVSWEYLFSTKSYVVIQCISDSRSKCLLERYARVNQRSNISKVSTSNSDNSPCFSVNAMFARIFWCSPVMHATKF